MWVCWGSGTEILGEKRKMQTSLTAASTVKFYPEPTQPHFLFTVFSTKKGENGFLGCLVFMVVFEASA